MSGFLLSTSCLATLRETLLERVRVVGATEEILHRVRRVDVPAGREHEVAVAMCLRDVHQPVREPAPDFGGDNTGPQVCRVRGGITLVAHVLPVVRPVRLLELTQA